jgi:hypothetical protein
MTNRISAELGAESVTDIKKKLNDIRAGLSFLLSLTKEERKNKQNMGQGGVGFGKAALKAAQTHNEILPVKFSVTEFQKDVLLYEQLQMLLSDLSTLCQNVDDTVLLLGQEIMEQSNDVYDSVKLAAKRENKYKATLEELSTYYKRKGMKKASTPIPSASNP